MIKLIVSDIDGTLLNDKHQVTQKVKEAVHKVRESGVSFMAASGRDYLMLNKVMNQLGEKAKCICLNGAQHYDNEGNLLIKHELSKKQSIQIMDIVNKYNVDADFMSGKQRYHYGPKDLHRDLLLARFMILFKSSDKDMLLHFIEDNEMLDTIVCEQSSDKILEKEIHKIELYASNLAHHRLIMDEIKQIDGLSVVNFQGLNIEITSAFATKGDMVAHICEHYGYEEDEVVVIGDAQNDATMLARFKHSYAMGQASDEIKAMATHVTQSNEEDGVACVINKVLEYNKK